MGSQKREKHGDLIIVAAHADDEVIGASSVLLRYAQRCRVVHVTDGAPRNMQDAHAAGYASREAYACARRGELVAALARAGIHHSASQQFEIVDQEATFALEVLARTLAELFDREAPSAVITHAYEGGHPDHDAVAFAVQAAGDLLRSGYSTPPSVVEMTSYHAGPRGIETGTFIGCGSPVRTVRLDARERQAKTEMLRCFTTQQRVLTSFDTECERFRAAPRYCFLEPPHQGRLFYEHFDWGVDGHTWRAHAARALRSLGLPAPVAGHEQRADHVSESSG